MEAFILRIWGSGVRILSGAPMISISYKSRPVRDTSGRSLRANNGLTKGRTQRRCMPREIAKRASFTFLTAQQRHISSLDTCRLIYGEERGQVLRGSALPSRGCVDSRARPAAIDDPATSQPDLRGRFGKCICRYPLQHALLISRVWGIVACAAFFATDVCRNADDKRSLGVSSSRAEKTGSLSWSRGLALPRETIITAT
jgi:hypothetical protein